MTAPRYRKYYEIFDIPGVEEVNHNKTKIFYSNKIENHHYFWTSRITNEKHPYFLIYCGFNEKK